MMTLNNILLLIYPVILLFVVFWGARTSPKGELSQKFLSLEQTKAIQAAACIAIMIHHVTQKITSYGSNPRGPITIFNYIGFMFTALFFFFSGYGLIISYYNKEDYLGKFLVKRLIAVLIPFWSVNVCIILIDAFYRGEKISAWDTFKSIIGTRLINSNGWFIIEIVVLYLLFYGLFSLVKKSDLALTLLIVFTIAIVIYSFNQGHDSPDTQVHWFRGEWWYNSTIAFIYGLLYARFKDKIEGHIKKHYITYVIFFSLLTLIFIKVTVYAIDHLGYYRDFRLGGNKDAAITLIIQSMTCIVFTTLIILLNMKAEIGNRALKYISSILLPLFLIHGYIVNELLAEIRVSDFLRYAIIIVTSIGSTAILAPVIGILTKKITSAFLSDKKKNDTLEAVNAEKLRTKILKKLRKAVAIAIIVFVVGMSAYLIACTIIQSKEYEEEQRELAEAKIGDVVYFGHFDTSSAKPGKERMTWLVVKEEDNRICLLSEYGISDCWYNQQHKEVTWEDSDIRRYLNSEKFTGMFTTKESELVSINNGDMITLLTASEALDIFETDKDRELAITDVAEKNGANKNTPSKVNSWDMKGYRSSWWWLRGENTIGSVTAPIVTVDGTVVMDEKPVNKPGGAIRPVIWILLR